MRRLAFVPAMLMIAATTFAATATVSAAPAQVEVIQLRQTSEALRDTYAKGKRIGIPRIIMFDADGRLIYGDAGFREDLARRMHQAYSKRQVIKAPITLENVLAEAETSHGERLALNALPKADLYVVDWWAQWCEPCRLISRVVEGTLKHWDGVHSVWLQVESDPEKLDKGA